MTWKGEGIYYVFFFKKSAVIFLYYSELALSFETIGSAVTRPLRFAGDRLELNVVAQGTIRIEIQDENGKTIPGFSLDDCDPIQGDHLRRFVTWNGKADVGNFINDSVDLISILSKAPQHIG